MDRVINATTDWFHSAPVFCARRRATISLPPPGANGTTMRTGLSGQAHHATGAHNSAAATAMAMARVSIKETY